jgi:DNA-binding MarR family transcriptional regulator
MTVQQTTRDAYAVANLTLRQRQVYAAFAVHGSLTDLETQAATGLPINIVTSTRNRLRELGLVADSGERKRGPHGLRNIVWRLERRDDIRAGQDLRQTELAESRQLSLL